MIDNSIAPHEPYRTDYAFRIKKSLITPQVEFYLQKLRDINVEVRIEPEETMAQFGGVMPLKYENDYDRYPPDIYEILQPLYKELITI